MVFQKYACWHYFWSSSLKWASLFVLDGGLFLASAEWMLVMPCSWVVVDSLSPPMTRFISTKAAKTESWLETILCRAPWIPCFYSFSDGRQGFGGDEFEVIQSDKRKICCPSHFDKIHESHRMDSWALEGCQGLVDFQQMATPLQYHKVVVPPQHRHEILYWTSLNRFGRIYFRQPSIDIEQRITMIATLRRQVYLIQQGLRVKMDQMRCGLLRESPSLRWSVPDPVIPEARCEISGVSTLLLEPLHPTLG